MIGLPNGLCTFQENCIEYLLRKVADPYSRNVIKIKSPTGSGKTIILIGFIEKYLNLVSRKTAFIWLSPGKGNLEEQSKAKMDKHLPSKKTMTLKQALISGFEEGSTTFVNWELVSKNGNKAIKDTEKRNLYDRITKAHNNGISFVIIVDEEHSNDTEKAQDILDLFKAKNIIRASATAKDNGLCEFYSIDELAVIGAGLITKAIYVNEGVEDGADVSKDYDYLLDLAIAKQNEIAKAYSDLNKKIRPLVLIQFPNGKPETIALVLEKLKSKGFTTENGMVSVWMSERKEDIPDNITDNNAEPIFLLMKQAISTGWDCPRAKILVKLREGGTESFQIQTIGRIRRMPEPQYGHYGKEILDYSYVYTLDEEFKAGLMNGSNRAYEKKILDLKDECKSFKLIKELKDPNFIGAGDLDILKKIFEYMCKKYTLCKDISNNRVMLDGQGFKFGNKIYGMTLQGLFIKSEALMKDSENKSIKTEFAATSSNAGLQLNHVIYQINKITHMDSRKIRVILDVLFWAKETEYKQYKILALDTPEHYAFIINNEKKLVELFRKVSSQMSTQLTLHMATNTEIFQIPHSDSLRYDPLNDTGSIYQTNVYSGYTNGFVSKVTRSRSERLFENYCEDKHKNDIKWIYKNGDTGDQYFSVVYYNGFGEQSLFYPDYIIMKQDGALWIIETKGGETNGNDNNIDDQIGNKFNALKRYSEQYNVNWGFVRDRDTKLLIKNTKFTESLQDEHWIELEKQF